jgi:hypothetical protein
MNAVATALRELWGLFVEDASLTLGILACLVIAALAFPALRLRDAWRGPVLFVLLVIVLLENVRRSARPLPSDRKVGTADDGVEP